MDAANMFVRLMDEKQNHSVAIVVTLGLLLSLTTAGCSVLDSGASLPTIAFTGFDQSTYRSQDADRDYTPAANRRLSFDEMLSSSRQDTAESSVVNQPSLSGSSNQDSTVITFGHSTRRMPAVPSANEVETQSEEKPALRMDVDAIRRIMNSQSSNDMSEGRVLSDIPAELSAKVVTQQSPQTGEPENATTHQETSSNPADSFSTVSASSELTEPAPDVESPPATDVQAEPTMLGRLKELYDPVEENSREFLRRPFQRIPSPWSLLKEREQPQVSQQSDTSTSPMTAAVDQPAPEQPANPSGQLLAQVIEQTEHQLANWPRQPNGQPQDPVTYQKRQMDLRMLYLMIDKPASAMSAIENLPPTEQEFWQELMLGISQFRSRSINTDPEQHRAGTVSQIRAAVRHLQQTAMLSIRRMEFCSRINSFGSVENFPTNDFDPGQPVLVYVEVDNFGMEIDRDGKYRTAFSARLDFYLDGTSQPVESIDVVNIDDTSTSLRNDFYHSFELTIPSHFATGRYQLRLSLRDHVSHRESSSSIEFQVR